MTIGEEPTNSQKVQELQAALHAKAKGSPAFRFYALYDKVYRKDVLATAFWQCRRNDGVRRARSTAMASTNAGSGE